MLTSTVPVPALNRGPGILWRAPIGTALPSNTVAGSVFTDLFSAVSGWVKLGATEEGTEVSYEIDEEDVTAAEFLDPLDVAETGRTVEVSFGLVSFNKSTLLAAYNAGSSAAVVTGSGATTLTTISPPLVGASVNAMLAFESEDSTYRCIYTNVKRVGGTSRSFKPGADKTVVPFTYRALADTTTGLPFKEYFAGATRGA